MVAASFSCNVKYLVWVHPYFHHMVVKVLILADVQLLFSAKDVIAVN